jgi:large repetitive protein
VERAGVAAFGALVAALAVSIGASAAGSPIVIESFTHITTISPDWTLPSAPTGTNVACLTASSDASQTPIPGCALAPPDPDGSGALRLTDALNSEEGGVAFTETLPTTKGLDVRFNSYQYGGDGADGIGFFLAATNPASPAPPTNIGQPGGELGYASGPATGLADGYLGIGIDVYGNYTNGAFDGSGCTDPSWVDASNPVPGQVTVRGPGNGSVGYCPLTSTAATDGGAPQALDGGPGGGRASSGVPLEIAVNPSASPLTTTSGLVVPAGDYVVAFTPIGGALQSFNGTLPTSTNGEIPSGTIPSAWINPATGLPFQLTMGWVGSTGGLTDIHEITDASVHTLSGKLPGLTATLNADPVQNGQTSTYALHVSTTSAGGPETQTIHVTDTFPSSVKPIASGAGGTGWVCSVTGQTDTCTYTVTGALAPGTALPPLSMPVIVEAAQGTTIVDTASVSSNDVFPVTATAAFVVGGSITVPPTGSGPLMLAPQLLIGTGLLASGAGLWASGLAIRRRVLAAVTTSANALETEPQPDPR